MPTATPTHRPGGSLGYFAKPSWFYAGLRVAAVLVPVGLLAALLGAAAALTAYAPGSRAGALLVGFTALGFVGLFWALAWLSPAPAQPPDRTALAYFTLAFAALLLWPRYVSLGAAGPLGLNLTQFLYAGLMVLWAGLLLWSPPTRARLARRLAGHRAVTAALLLLLGWRLASVFRSDELGFSAYWWVNDAVSYYLVFFIALTVIADARAARRWVALITIVGVAVTVLALVESALGHNLFLSYLAPTDEYVQSALRDKSRGGGYRAQATFENPLLLGQFLAWLLPLLVFFLVRGRGRAVRLAALAALPILGLAVVANASRSSLVATAAVTLLLVLVLAGRSLRSATPGRIAAAFAGLAVLATVVAVAIPELADIARGRGLETQSTSGRLLMLERAVPLVLERPLLGHGVLRAAFEVGYRTPTGFLTIDSYPISLAVESGLPALLLFFGLLGYFVGLGVWLAVRRADDASLLAGALGTSLLGMGVFLVITSLPHNLPFVFAGFGLLVVLREEARLGR